MVNGIYFNVNRGGDDDSLYSSSSGFSSRRSDFPNEEGDWKKSSSSVYSIFRSWIRSPMPPEIIPYEDLRQFRWTKLKKLTGNFDHMSIVGRTENTAVFCATLSTGEAAAVKDIYPGSIEGSDSYIAAMLAEVSTLKHQNLLGLLGYCLDLNKRILVYPFATMGSLHDIMHGRKGVKGSEPGPVLTWNQRVKIACGAAQALEYLHSVDIIHGAIKSSNILIFDDFVPKIADIFLSKESPYKNTVPWHAARATSPDPYFPPEHDSSTQATKKCDIYRFGVVLLELLTGRKADFLTLCGHEYISHSWVFQLAYQSPHEGPTKKAEAGWGGWDCHKKVNPRLWEEVHAWIDPKLNPDYPPKAVEKMAHIAALCVQYKYSNRPVMNIVVRALQSLLNKVGETSNSVSSPPPQRPSFS